MRTEQISIYLCGYVTIAVWASELCFGFDGNCGPGTCVNSMPPPHLLVLILEDGNLFAFVARPHLGNLVPVYDALSRGAPVSTRLS